jgi:hypothetical protein
MWPSPASRPAALWFPDSLETGKAAVQFNLAVGFAPREEWDRAGSIAHCGRVSDFGVA